MSEVQKSDNPTVKSVKVVLDTNVVISAVLSHDGIPAKIFEMLLSGNIQNYTTKEIVEEIKDVLERLKITKLVDNIQRRWIITNFEQSSICIKPSVNLTIIKNDPDDNKFLECAVSAQAKYIISGDTHLTDLKRYHDILIVTPTEFFRIIKHGK
jgi:uncharacterized protein